MSEQPDEACFAAMVREHLPMFRGLSRRILSVPADVDDAVQSALLKGWRRRNSFRGESKMAYWVARIVINESYDLLRKRLRERERLTEYTPAAPDDPGQQDEQLRLLDDAIAKLPEIYRETVHLAVLSDLGAETAAQMLGCTTNALYQRIHKAKELLRRRLSHEQS